MSDLQPESLETFKRLLSEQTSYINEVDQQISKWTQFQNDYRHLHTRLSTLPDRLTYECMVPFGKLAFIPGRIVHSNEILVLLGDNYFVERSCKQSIEIVNRRLKNINENIEKHQKEKEVFNQQKQYTNNFLDDKTKFIEIKETDDDDDNNNKQEKKTLNRRAKLTEDEIREERRRLQERAMKMNETQTKHVHFEDDHMEVDNDDNEDDDDEEEEIPNQQFKKICINHTKSNNEPIGDSSPALFAHPGAIGKTEPAVFTEKVEPVAFTGKTESVAFTGKTIERQDTTSSTEPPPKRISKFRASRQ